jgi:uncharacterized protein YndB with AHSA1/START domain
MSRPKTRKRKGIANKLEMIEELRKTIVVNAEPEVVFKALTEAKELVEWMPNEAKMDARVGGEYEFK